MEHIGTSIQHLVACYQADTNRVIQWMVNATGHTENEVNSTTILRMARYIRANNSYVPSEIFRHLKGAIEGRTAINLHFEKQGHIHVDSGDSHLAQRNESHKHFINILEKSFLILGGNEWEALQAEGWEGALILQQSVATGFDQVTEALDTAMPPAPLSEDDLVSHRNAHQCPDLTASSQKTAASRKSRARRKKDNRKASQHNKGKSPCITYNDCPLHMEHDLGADYMLAAEAVIHKMISLRGKLHEVWLATFSDKNFDISIAGTLSHVAIGMVKGAQLALFLDFPDKDSFACVADATIQHSVGTLEDFSHHELKFDRETTNNADMQEATFQFSSTYQVVLQYITECQESRRGQPTKATIASFSQWDSSLDLLPTTQDGRQEWIKQYTSNLLYNIMESYSAGNTVKQGGGTSNLVDTAKEGGTRHHQPFALTEFASLLKTLAMLKPGTPFSHRILPHHVFTLQVMVDSYAASCGWFWPKAQAARPHNPFRGHEAVAKLSPFFGLGADSIQRDYRSGWDALSEEFSVYKTCNGGESLMLHEACKAVLELSVKYFDKVLANHEESGILFYSPFLCSGVLVDSLDVSYRTAMCIWQRLPEPIMLIHIHQMLVQLGRIRKPVEALVRIQCAMPEAFFEGGEAPKADFHVALDAYVRCHRGGMQKRRAPNMIPSDPMDIHEFLHKCPPSGDNPHYTALQTLSLAG